MKTKSTHTAKNEQYSGEARHTPTPWKVMSDAQTIVSEGPGKDFVAETIRRMDDNGHTHDESNHEIDAAFIVRAVNAHEGLLTAMRKAVKDIESAMNTSTFPPSCGIPMENAKVILELAVAKAEASTRSVSQDR